MVYDRRLLLQMSDNVNGWFNYWHAGLPVVADGQWHFVAVTVDRDSPTGGRFYIDGNLVWTFDPTNRSGSLDNASPLNLGRDGFGRDYFDGTIDEVEIFKRSLPAATIQALYAAGRDGKCKCLTPPDELVAWYPLDEVTGSVANDIASNHDGTYNGTLSVAGHVDGARSFNGTSDFVAVPDHVDVDFGTGDFSIDAWIGTSAPRGTIVGKRASVGGPGYLFQVYDSRLLLQMGDNVNGRHNYSTRAMPVVADGKWHFVAVTVDRDSPTGGRFYIDGNLVWTFDPTNRSGSLDNASPLNLGRDSVGQDYFNGAIDEVEIFKRALPQSEILNLFAAGRVGKCKK